VTFFFAHPRLRKKSRPFTVIQYFYQQLGSPAAIFLGKQSGHWLEQYSNISNGGPKGQPVYMVGSSFYSPPCPSFRRLSCFYWPLGPKEKLDSVMSPASPWAPIIPWVGPPGMGSDNNLLPVPFFHSWVAGNAEERKVLLKLINLQLDILC
jgi:hypothetical protein